MQEISVSLLEAKNLVEHTFDSGLVPMLHGAPGVGKTSIFRQIAKEYNLLLIELHLTSREPTDLNGLPTKNDEGRLAFIADEEIPLATDPLPTWKNAKGDLIEYDGFLLLLDELPNAHPQVLKAAYRLILDKKLGKHDLHPACFIAAAGNRSSDNAMSGKLPTPLKRRMVHLNVEVSAKDVIENAIKNDWDYRVISYMNWKPAAISSFNPHDEGMTFCCAATLEMLSSIIKGIEDISKLTPIITGAIGTAYGLEFVVMSKLFKELESYDTIMANPYRANVPTELGSLYALCGMIASKAKPAQGSMIMGYILRLPTEFQALLLRWLCSSDMAWDTVPEVTDWIRKNSHLVS